MKTLGNLSKFSKNACEYFIVFHKLTASFSRIQKFTPIIIDISVGVHFISFSVHGMYSILYHYKYEKTFTTQQLHILLAVLLGLCLGLTVPLLEQFKINSEATSMKPPCGSIWEMLC